MHRWLRFEVNFCNLRQRTACPPQDGFHAPSRKSVGTVKTVDADRHKTGQLSKAVSKSSPSTGCRWHSPGEEHLLLLPLTLNLRPDC
ncbi:hypothetical protein V5799_004732 [Amblyomma americanum]|uniref:Uncharacterized protein n=1 Tax=Amblyomma americanum TaxID=6943 RepID=A0AAQ4D598_AMBAM